jgi:hypothetical protein
MLSYDRPAASAIIALAFSRLIITHTVWLKRYCRRALSPRAAIGPASEKKFWGFGWCKATHRAWPHMRKTHEVLVTEDGFEWCGRSWRSLSLIAKEITGTRWSGPRFFGLAGPMKKSHPAADAEGETYE